MKKKKMIVKPDTTIMSLANKSLWEGSLRRIKEDRNKPFVCRVTGRPFRELKMIKTGEFYRELPSDKHLGSEHGDFVTSRPTTNDIC